MVKTLLERITTTNVVLAECRFQLSSRVKKKDRHKFADLGYRVYEYSDDKKLSFRGNLPGRYEVYQLQEALDSLKLKPDFGWVENVACGRIYQTTKTDLLAAL